MRIGVKMGVSVVSVNSSLALIIIERASCAQEALGLHFDPNGYLSIMVGSGSGKKL